MAAKMGKIHGPRTGGSLKGIHLVPPGHRACRNLMQGYKADAMKRSLPFDLEFETFMELTSSSCAYCGAKPGCIKPGPQKKVKTDYVYNGLDRVDSSKGYIQGNVRPCCKWCNRAKFDRSEIDFKAWAVSLSKWALA
jgi:hypothetical protein